jgi:hypothetical protein
MLYSVGDHRNEEKARNPKNEMNPNICTVLDSKVIVLHGGIRIVSILPDCILTRSTGMRGNQNPFLRF